MNRIQSGWFFIILGIILNQWFLAIFVSDDGIIESKNIKIIIWFFDFILITIGSLILYKILPPISKNLIFSFFSFFLVILFLELGLGTIHYFKNRIINNQKEIYINKEKKRMSHPYFKNLEWASKFWKEYYSTYQDGRSIQYKPYIGWNRQEFIGEYININSDGMRNTWQPNLDNEDGLPTLYVFGGSTVWGSGARDNHTIPSELSKIFYENSDPHIVYNYGESAYSITNNIMELIVLLKEGKIPDKVIFYNGTNLVHGTYINGDPKINPYMNLFAQRMNYGKYNSNALDHLRLFIHKLIFKHSKIVKLLNKPNDEKEEKYKPSSIPNNDLTQKLGNEIIKYYLHCLSLLNNLADGYGFEIMLIWQPTIFTEKKIFEIEKSFDELFHNKQLSELFVYCDQQLSNIDIKNFQNLSNVFAKKNDPIFIDFTHTTGEGNRIIAEKIYSIISD